MYDKHLVVLVLLLGTVSGQTYATVKLYVLKTSIYEASKHKEKTKGQKHITLVNLEDQSFHECTLTTVNTRVTFP